MSRLEDLTARIVEGQDTIETLDGFSIEEVSGVILQLLRGRGEAYFHATTLLRDLVLQSDSHSDSDSIRDGFRRSYLAGQQAEIVAVMEADLTADDVLVRRTATYTLGEIGAKASLPQMQAALSLASQQYPDVVYQLAAEICWLLEANASSLDMVQKLSESERVWDRWAAVEVLVSHPLDGGDALLKKLCADSHPYVRRQAKAGHDDGQTRLKWSWVAAAFQSTCTSGTYQVADFENFVDSYMARHAPKLHREVPAK